MLIFVTFQVNIPLNCRHCYTGERGAQLQRQAAYRTMNAKANQIVEVPYILINNCKHFCLILDKQLFVVKGWSQTKGISPLCLCFHFQLFVKVLVSAFFLIFHDMLQNKIVSHITINFCLESFGFSNIPVLSIFITQLMKCEIIAEFFWPTLYFGILFVFCHILRFTECRRQCHQHNDASSPPSKVDQLTPKMIWEPKPLIYIYLNFSIKKHKT